jgi:hypothetical protein
MKKMRTHDERQAPSLTPIPKAPLEKGRGGAPMVPPPTPVPTPAAPNTTPPENKK